ncbi:MAG: HNH endonuclease [Thermodesulfobacteriota bacterium]
MKRKDIFYDIPDEWIINRNKGLCPVCAKTKDEFEKNRKIYCSQKCSDEYGSKIYVWQTLRDEFLKEKGEVCNECGITEKKLNEEKKQKIKDAQEKFKKNCKEKIEYEKKEIMEEIDKLHKMLFDDDLLLEDRGYLMGYPSSRGISFVDIGFQHRSFEVDHIIAIANGGNQWDKSNLQVLCNICHKKKTAKDIGKLKHKRKGQEFLNNEKEEI